MVGAVFPDLDLIWFYLIDDRAFHHHKYWVHAPAFVIASSAVLVAAAKFLLPKAAPLTIAFTIGWCLHVMLDAPVGGTMWLWPLTDKLYVPIEVPATQSHWILSFVLHWSFLFEVVIWLVALGLYLQKR